MKLINRQDINKGDAYSRKRMIDEGLTIARKINAMRQELAEMEKKRLTFIEQSKAEIEKATLPLYERIEVLKNEIKILERKREEAIQSWKMSLLNK